MHEQAIAWASEALGAPVTTVEQLSGGLTSTMLRISDAAGHRAVLRLMTIEPWRTHGPALTRRERTALTELEPTAVPAPRSLGLDAEGHHAGVAAHLLSHLDGSPTEAVDDARIRAMADLLAEIHAFVPAEPFRGFQSWAFEAKWVVPEWTHHADSWRAAFEVLAGPQPAFEPTFLHRDFSHRNLLWHGPAVRGVVDWVETSTGPAWLDAGHAATNLAVAFGPEPAHDFLAAYAERTGEPQERYWLVMDTVGFLPPPGREPLFGSPEELRRLDDWLHDLVGSD